MTCSKKKTNKNFPPTVNLSCTLDYWSLGKDFESFEAYLKLSNDPKMEKLNIDNFIPKGCVLKKSDWIVGLVVYADSETKMMNINKFKFYKSSFLERVSQIYFLVIFGCVFITALVSLTLKHF